VCYQPYNLVFVACKVKQLPFLFVIAVAHIHNFAQAILRNLDLKEGLAGAEAYPSLIKSRNFGCLLILYLACLNSIIVVISAID